MLVKNGQTDVTTYFVLRDSTNHAPKTDVTVTDIDLYYVEELAAISAKADATALDAADSAHADNKAFHVGQGMYRIDWPDAAFDGGIGKKVQLIVVCSGVDTTFLEVELSAPVDSVAISGDATAADNAELMFDGTGYAGGTTKLGVDMVAISGDSTAADNLEAACDGNTYNVGGGAVVAASVTAEVSANVTKISGDGTAADNAEAFFDGTGYAGTNNVIPTVTTLTGHTAQTGDAFARLGAPAGASVSADIAAVKSDTAAILTDTGTTLDTLIKDIPTVAEFEARTLVAADYVVVGDTLAAVTTVGSVTGAVGSVTAEVSADVVKISGDSTAADRLEAILDATPNGAVVDDNDPDPSTTAFETNLSEATNDHYNGAFVVFTSGALLGQSRKISDYDGTTKVVTVATAFTEAPAGADTFIIIGRSE